ncbi:hypothetical protein [Microbacterium invictum]|uniref:Cell division protein FtsL n=1 Tax=Microbacterium invictum TaxID=515415 RepID=A0AA40SNA8_9MICO|nr:MULTISPECIES: hypothetical protein [Microbacterium]MBB4139385.1 hypothetical protein [Microbacterium invictum]
MSLPALPIYPAPTSPRIAAPAPSPASDPRRGLRALEQPQPARRPRLLYGIIAVGGALAIAAAQMGLSILTTQGSYEVASLTSQQRELDWQRQMLADDVAGLSSPQYLAANASALGMVVGQIPNHLRLSDGAIAGTGKAAGDSSSIRALSRAAVGNELINGVPLVTDPQSSLDSGTAVDDALLNIPTPPPITDGLPTPDTH